MKIACITPNLKHDFLTETVLEGFKKLGAHLVCSDVGNGIDTTVNDDTFVTEAKTADLILVFFGKVRGNLPPKRYLLDRISRPEITAYIDGSEWTCTGYPTPGQVQAAKTDYNRRRGEPWNDSFMMDRSRCSFYFKRECYQEDVALGLIPLPFGVVDKYLVSSEKKEWDLFCCFGQNNDGLRREAQEVASELSAMGYKIFDKTGLPHLQYLKELKKSKIAVDAWGGGDCCARFWEIVGNGTACVYQKYNIVIPDPFDNRSAIAYSTKQELKESILRLLNSEEEREKIAYNGRIHALSHHTSLARANYILRHVKK